MASNKISKEGETVHLFQMNIHKSNTYRKIPE